MKRGLVFVVVAILLQPISAQSSTTITLAEPTHRSSTGIFFDDGLAQLVSPSGRLGKLLFDRNGRNHSWVIDAALVEEVADLADGYTYLDEQRNEVIVPGLIVADIWLNTLKSATKNSYVAALPYGNPSPSVVLKNGSGEMSLYRALGQQRLSELLSKPAIARTSGANPGLPGERITLYKELRQSMAIINSLVTLREVENLRLKLAQLLNPAIEDRRYKQLAKDLEIAVTEMNQRIRVSSGNYTITSSEYELPVTIINGFDQQINLDVRASATNSRIVVGSLPRISVGAQSQLQTKVPLTIIASGDTTLRIQLWSPAGERVGELTRIPLRLAVISTSTTWFATVLALILLLAVITQSVRRVKKRKNG